MQRNESYPYQQSIEVAFRSLGESWAVARNIYGTLTIYLLYRCHFYPLGSPESVAGLSLGALSETIGLAKRHSELGYQTLRGLVPESERVSGTPDEQLVAPNWLQELRPPAQQLVAQYAVPLARLCLPVSTLHQMLQLPDDFAIKQVTVEDEALCVYCLAPECGWLDMADGTPVILADYQIEERDDRQWRSPVSILVKQAGRTVGGNFYVTNHRDTAIDL